MTREEMFELINDRYVKYDPRDISNIMGITMYQKDLTAHVGQRGNGWSLHIWQNHQSLFARGCTDGNPMNVQEVISTLDSYFERKTTEQMALF